MISQIVKGLPEAQVRNSASCSDCIEFWAWWGGWVEAEARWAGLAGWSECGAGQNTGRATRSACRQRVTSRKPVPGLEAVGGSSPLLLASEARPAFLKLRWDLWSTDGRASPLGAELGEGAGWGVSLSCFVHQEKAMPSHLQRQPHPPPSTSHSPLLTHWLS